MVGGMTRAALLAAMSRFAIVLLALAAVEVARAAPCDHPHAAPTKIPDKSDPEELPTAAVFQDKSYIAPILTDKEDEPSNNDVIPTSDLEDVNLSEPEQNELRSELLPAKEVHIPVQILETPFESEKVDGVVKSIAPVQTEDKPSEEFKQQNTPDTKPQQSFPVIRPFNYLQNVLNTVQYNFRQLIQNVNSSVTVMFPSRSHELSGATQSVDAQKVQTVIKEFETSVQESLNSLNQTAVNMLNRPDGQQSLSQEDQQLLQNRIQALQQRIQQGMHSVGESVVTVLNQNRNDPAIQEAGPSTTTVAPNAISLFIQNIQESWNNIQNTLQGNTTPETQADEGSTTPSNQWLGIFGFLNPNRVTQADEASTTPASTLGFFQNLWGNWFPQNQNSNQGQQSNQNAPQAAAQAISSIPQTSQQTAQSIATNVQQSASNVEPSAIQNAIQSSQSIIPVQNDAQSPTTPRLNLIQQAGLAFQNNPIVQGINQLGQRVQSLVPQRDTPRKKGCYNNNNAATNTATIHDCDSDNNGKQEQPIDN